MNYFVNEGNKIGYLPTSFASNGGIVEKKIVASGDIVKGHVVEISGDLTVAHAAAKSNKVIGVAMFDAKKGEPAAVECEGLFSMISAGAITAGSKVASAANGTVATAGDTDPVIGTAISTSIDGGEVFVKFSI